MLGSAKALEALSDTIYIPVIYMEWLFSHINMLLNCKKENVQKMTNGMNCIFSKVFQIQSNFFFAVLVQSGYVAVTRLNGKYKTLDMSNSFAWPQMEIMEWIHKNSTSFKKAKISK